MMPRVRQTTTKLWWRSSLTAADMVCSRGAWASTVCAVFAWSVPISPVSCVRRVRACAPHCCDQKYFMSSLLASPDARQPLFFTAKTACSSTHLITGWVVLDCAWLWTALTRLGLFTVPRAIAPLTYAEPAD